MFEMDPRRAQYQTDAQGRRTAVVLPMSEYEQLLEDLHDLAVVAERRDDETIDEAELRRRLAGGGAV
jgi:PHD/YefM family antitoxin component YafN of YafNO toxin-antitoxin module